MGYIMYINISYHLSILSPGVMSGYIWYISNLWVIQLISNHIKVISGYKIDKGSKRVKFPYVRTILHFIQQISNHITVINGYKIDKGSKKVKLPCNRTILHFLPYIDYQKGIIVFCNLQVTSHT